MLAPARIPVAAGKNMANIEKNVSSSLKSGPRFSKKMAPVGGESQTNLKSNTVTIRSETFLTFVIE